MLRRLIGEDIALTLELRAADLGTVKADPGHIEQVIMNLVRQRARRDAGRRHDHRSRRQRRHRRADAERAGCLPGRM